MPTSKSSIRELVGPICDKFTAACGWTLRFHLPHAEESATHLKQCFWTRELNDGEQSAGWLSIEEDANNEDQSASQVISQLAELTGDVLELAIRARRSADLRDAEVEQLAEIGLTVTQEPDIHEGLQQLMRAGAQLTGFRAGAFFLLHPTGEQLDLRVVYQTDKGEIPRERRTLDDASPDLLSIINGNILVRRSMDRDLAEWLPSNMAMGLCLPITSESGPIGTFWGFDRRDRRPDPREIHVLGSIASQMGSLLERAVLKKESDSERVLRRELTEASENLPGDTETDAKDLPGIQAATMSIAASHIGGDLCELLPVCDDRTLVVIGDAVGHGAAAAMLMSAVKGIVRTTALAPPSDVSETDRIVSQINQVLCSMTRPHQFMSLLLGVFDTRTNLFTYTNAGHPNPITVRNGRFGELESHGLLLGVTEDAEYERSELIVNPGDVFTMFTDGITEAVGRRQQMFRSDGIVGAIKETALQDPELILRSIWNHMEDHRGSAPADDDRTILVIQYHGQQQDAQAEGTALNSESIISG
ncbi:PP2C family protein-serine/threonine phosphatase [Calycomorphotria hydatis]|uniref:Phosphoserine phosphatase RsbU n=1 Tax=Calycomorphotria hydatis TaxID=2528027 RepID=A0A517T9G9_9PLAN|nr:GAF domain-containing SpoIIE family protein phosphatase [Calycomorphotria hydatis]QDT65017.1 Phosphoserine phosphatase RsbU [Calycomorphotria hydatis]